MEGWPKFHVASHSVSWLKKSSRLAFLVFNPLKELQCSRAARLLFAGQPFRNSGLVNSEQFRQFRLRSPAIGNSSEPRD